MAHDVPQILEGDLPVTVPIEHVEGVLAHALAPALARVDGGGQELRVLNGTVAVDVHALEDLEQLLLRDAEATAPEALLQLARRQQPVAVQVQRHERAAEGAHVRVVEHPGDDVAHCLRERVLRLEPAQVLHEAAGQPSRSRARGGREPLVGEGQGRRGPPLGALGQQGLHERLGVRGHPPPMRRQETRDPPRYFIEHALLCLARERHMTTCEYESCSPDAPNIALRIVALTV
mmetsp:Transcript_100025/g.283145  ORF Transcript_100025/g.283145 Transcript_100025/m.283145 type:complete len:233 (+) Transcript_100025:362-1060(+)